MRQPVGKIWQKRRSILWLWGSLLVLLCWHPPRPLLAQDPTWQSQATFTFGQSLTFSLTAVSPANTQQLTLFVQHPALSAPYFVRVPFHVADGTLRVAYTVQPAQLTLPPFATVTYWWQLDTAAGETLLSPTQTAVYQDDRFLWQQLIGQVGTTPITLFWASDDDVPGQAAYQLLQSWLPRLEGLLPLSLAEPLPIFLYPSAADLRAALRLNGYDWAQQQVDPALGVVMVTAVNSRTSADDLRHNLPHELAQFWLYQAAGAPHYPQLPFWLKAGLPGWLQPPPRPTAVLPQLSLAELCQPQLDQADSPTAVADSVALFNFFEATYGAEALAQLIGRLVAGEPCTTAVADSVGHSLANVEARWQAVGQPATAVGQWWQENGAWMLLVFASFAIMALLIFQPKAL